MRTATKPACSRRSCTAHDSVSALLGLTNSESVELLEEILQNYDKAYSYHLKRPGFARRMFNVCCSLL